MNVTDFFVQGDDIVLRQSELDLDQTLDCGQAFRWERISPDTYHGYFLNNELTISELQEKGVFKLHNVSEEQFRSVWFDYFDLGSDYSKMIETLSEDETLSKAVKQYRGTRILRQDPWETISSFIISQNNNIPRIKLIISRLCEHYSAYPSFEDMKAETVDTLSYLRAGFRAKYIVDAVGRFNSGEMTTEKIKTLSTDDARDELMKIKGVGPKVADCALLFGFHKLDAFPKDVWVKRVMAQYYPDGLPECTKGIEGVAQQYLFQYIRTVKT
ncbi:MAG: DNA-3-methyladenine glycosylase 2 family protein [Ruminococcus sp.]|nr:DNA-3-methyladenine glycosylase 2 family protein [Ruminococcus sp.]